MIAADADGLECEVACDRTPQPLRITLRLREHATVADALHAARAAWPDEAIDWETARVGVWGHECPRTRVLQPGDRVELYRALLQDPREARRRRVRRPAR